MTATTGPPIGQAAPPTTREGLPRWLDGARDVLGSADPGLNRLFQSLELIVAIGASIAVIYAFMQLTHVMWIQPAPGVRLSPAQVAEMAVQHHGITLLAMLLGGVIGMLSVFAVTEQTLKEEGLTLTLMPIPMLATMALAVPLVDDRAIGIAVPAVLVGVGSYLRKFIPTFGARMFVFGAELFVGFIFGFLSGGALQEDMIGWITVVLVISCTVNFVIKVLVARPLARGRLERIAMAFRARCRAVTGQAMVLFDAEDEHEITRTRRRLHRALVKVNETALVIDASLGDEHAAPRAAALDAHTELFDLELLVQELGRISERVASAPLPAELRIEIRQLLADLRLSEVDAAMAARAFEFDRKDGWQVECDEQTAALVGRLVDTIVAMADASRLWPRHHNVDKRGDEVAVTFESPVTLVFGDLPGSAVVSAETAGHGTSGRLARLGIDPFGQAAIRIAIAVGVAAGIGSILSERRFYWAVIAVFITFMGTNTSGEQLVKAANRVAGTLIGILIGSLLAHAVGVSTWSIAVIIGALATGIYFMKVSYGLMVIGITIAASELYEQLEEFSNHLLLLRLEETAIGAAVAAICALAIFPIPTRKVASIAVQGYLRALSDLLARASTRVAGGNDEGSLTAASRALDYANQQLIAAAKPLRFTPFRRNRLEHNIALLSITAHQARNVAAEITRHRDDFTPLDAGELAEALATERDAAVALAESLATGGTEAPAARLADLTLASLENALNDGDVRMNGYQRRLLLAVERLDAALSELRENLLAAPLVPVPLRRR
jgi:uncharacterized membrane protein YccC